MNTGPKNRAGRHRISQTMRRERRRLARSNSGSTQTKHTALCHHERASLPAATRAASELLATLGPKAPWGPGQARPLSTSESPTQGHAHGLMAAAAVSRCSRSPNQQPNQASSPRTSGLPLSLPFAREAVGRVRSPESADGSVRTCRVESGGGGSSAVQLRDEVWPYRLAGCAV